MLSQRGGRAEGIGDAQRFVNHHAITQVFGIKGLTAGLDGGSDNQAVPVGKLIAFLGLPSQADGINRDQSCDAICDNTFHPRLNIGIAESIFQEYRRKLIENLSAGHDGCSARQDADCRSSLVFAAGRLQGGIDKDIGVAEDLNAHGVLHGKARRVFQPQAGR